MKKIVFFLFLLGQLFCGIVFAEIEESLPESLYIEIFVKESRLYLYEKYSDNEMLLIESHPVASFKSGLSEYPIGLGIATKVIFNPFWYPTNETVAFMNKKLIKAGRKEAYTEGEKIPPGDPRNAMGSFKILLSHKTPRKGAVYRIHGTNDPTSIGKRASGGCTRMDDSKTEVKSFAKKIHNAIESGKLVEVNILLK